MAWSGLAPPIVADLRGYTVRDARLDIVAGLTVTAILVPQGMAYGELVGVPPIAGLYAAFGAMAAFALVSRTRKVIAGPDAALSAMSAAAIAPLAHGNPDQAVALAAALALMTGAFCLLGGVARLGFLAEFLSRPVVIGYVIGVALSVVISQLPKLLGIPRSPEPDVISVCRWVAEHLSDTGTATVVFGFVLITVLAVAGRRWPRFPTPLLVLVAATAATSVFDLADHGVAVSGDVPRGLPDLHLPDVDSGQLLDMLPSAAGIALLAFADTVAVARAFAGRTERVDANREALALGVSNLAVGCVGGFGVSTSASRTAVNDSAGARTQVSQVVALVALAVVLLLLTPLLHDLPTVALAAVVVVAASKLLSTGELRRLVRLWPIEAGVAVATLVGVLLLGVLSGLLVAVVLSVLNLVRKNAYPHDAVLGLDPATGAYRDIRYMGDVEGAVAPADVLVYRFEAPLFFANADRFRARVTELVDSATPPVQRLVIDADAIFYVDYTAVLMLRTLVRELEERDVVVVVARLRTRVRHELEAGGIIPDVLGRQAFFPALREAVGPRAQVSP
jgi:high affinity sulfate transporter 1